MKENLRAGDEEAAQVEAYRDRQDPVKPVLERYDMILVWEAYRT